MSMTRFPNGLATRKSTDPFGQYFHPDQTDEHRYAEDFNNYTASAWTVTVVGTSTPALVAGDGGLLGITTSTANNDSAFLQRSPEGYSFETGKPCWFSARFKVSALTSVVVMGLQVTDTTPEDVTDGIYFLSTTATGAITGIVRKNATTGSSSVSCGALVADTYTELAWYWDGKDTVTFYQDRVAKNSITGVAANYLPDTTVTPSFGLRTTTAAAKTMTVDFFYISKSRR
jgi:hypothetical protein